LDDKPSWDELRDEAALWLARLDSGSVSLQEFEVWRDADPRRAVAFVQLANALSTLDRLKPDLKANMLPIRMEPRRRLLWGGLAVAVVAAGGAGIWAAAEARATVATGVGERKAIAIPGGGSLALNTDSEIQWRSDKAKTEVWLKRGEVALDLAGASKPCLVYAAGRVADVRSARINARLQGKMLDVAVLSGACSVGSTRGPASGALAKADIIPANHAVLLVANQQVVRPLTEADREFLDGWQNGELVFQGQTLETAVAEYNRYLDRKIYIADPSLAGIRLGGRFTSRDPQVFLQGLHESFGIAVADSGTGPVVLTK